MPLPRDIRNKQENVILVGLIPGPKHDLIRALSQQLTRVLEWCESNYTCKKRIRCALACVTWGSFRLFKIEEFGGSVSAMD